MTRRRRLDPREALRAHVVERHLRAGVRAQDLSGDAPAQPRLSSEEWIDSCGLVAGVPSQVLDLLASLWCSPAGTTLEVVLLEAPDGTCAVEQREVARRRSLGEVAAEWGCSAGEVARALQDAMDRVADALVRRAQAGGDDGA